MTKEFTAAIEAAHRQIPFALFAFPGSQDYQFFANPNGELPGKPFFIINKWNVSFNGSLRIYEELDADAFLGNADQYPAQPCQSPLQTPSTTRDDYLQKITALIDHLKERGGKTVFSRIISEENITIDLMQLLETQFSSFPETFRFFYYIPQTGLWLGTSPELLLDYDRETGCFSTMSLAGTRETVNTQWDDKNIDEQNMVARFISDVLTSAGAQFTVQRCEDVCFKPVCHICDLFTGTLKEDNCPELLNRLSPTPALSGFPVRTAIEEISQLESHQRECYGGYVGYVTAAKLKCFVNLRSIKLTESGYCIFAGGGVTAHSVAEDEWKETENKTMILRKNLAEATH
ncbi:MAG: chorismate-binding protein [Muribaculaceae bacterium]|nr:chorismate-binding protein [Muribaculaceae bacterium]